MSCTKNMLSVLMDDLKDIDMILGYAKEAQEENQAEYFNWYKNHAQRRIQSMEQDYEYVMAKIDINNRIMNDDDIAQALKSYLESQMSNLKEKYNKL